MAFLFGKAILIKSRCKAMKFLKRIIQILLILIVLVAASVFIAMTFYKKELTGMLISSLKTEYGLDARVGSIDIALFENWPHASIRLKDASVRSTVNPTDTLPVFRAGSFSLSFEISKLLKKQFIVNSVSLENAEITLVKDSADKTNFMVMAQPPSGSSGQKVIFDIRKISLKQVHLKYLNQERKQDISILFADNTIKVAQHSEGYAARIKGEIHIDELLFKQEKGPFLKNTDASVDLGVNFFTKAKMIFADPSSYAMIDGQRFDLSSLIKLGDEKQLVLNIHTKQADYDKVRPLLNENIRHALEQISLDKPLDADVLLVAAIGKKQDPAIIVNVRGEHNNINIGNSKIPYKDVSFEAQVLCVPQPGQEPDMRQARIVISPLKGTIYDFPFTASVLIRDLKDPRINIDANLSIDASKVKFKPGQDLVLAGNCKASINYNGPVSGLKKATFLNDPMKLSAKLRFDKFSYRENPGSLMYTINGLATLNNHDLKFNNLLVQTACGDLHVNGSSAGFTPYAFGNSNGFKTTATVSSDLYNFNPMITVSPQDQGQPESKADKPAPKTSSSNFAFDITFVAKKALIRKIVATNVKAEFKYDHDLLSVPALNITACNGSLALTGSLYKRSDIKAKVAISNMDIKMLMEQFENFGQSAIEARNLRGIVSVDATIGTKLDNNMHVEPQTMDGEIKVKLKNGELSEYEPIQKLSNFVFKNRDFDHVTFSDLNQTFKIKGYEMQIDNMEVATNLLNLFVDGIYNFKGESNINLLIPWSNLKKRGDDYVPKKLGKAAEDTRGLKLNYHGFPNKLKLSLGNK